MYEIMHWLEPSQHQSKSGDHPKHKIRSATDMCDSALCENDKSQSSDDSRVARARVTP